MANTKKKAAARARRKISIRKKISGTSDRPRLSVVRSSKHIYAQVVDDVSGRTLVSASSLDKALRGELAGQNKCDQAKAVGAAVAKACLDADITSVCFDRNGFIYHGRVAAVAEGAREAGLSF